MSQLNTAVWGDGFVDDGWSEMASVKDWAALSPDEYVRLFPALVPHDGRIPDCLYRYLETLVAARAAQFRSSSTLLRIDPTAGSSAARDLAEENTALRFLSGVLQMARNDNLMEADPAAATTFGYLTSVHPAYLWPSAFASHERETTAAWLGVVARGRAALMPIEVAEYLLDVIECRDGRPVTTRDSQITALIIRNMKLEELWRAACRRRRGNSVVVRRRGAAPLDVGRLARQSIERLKRAYSATLSAGARAP